MNQNKLGSTSPQYDNSKVEAPPTALQSAVTSLGQSDSVIGQTHGTLNAILIRLRGDVPTCVGVGIGEPTQEGILGDLQLRSDGLHNNSLNTLTLAEELSALI